MTTTKSKGGRRPWVARKVIANFDARRAAMLEELVRLAHEKDPRATISEVVGQSVEDLYIKRTGSDLLPS
jgi:hypothetical protein